MLLDIGRATPACGFLNLDVASSIITPGATQLRDAPRRAEARRAATCHARTALQLIVSNGELIKYYTARPISSL
tara:strand:- start:465 stop:686 length:222 start_codon:yes stop_codon:yes gene_type:complete